MDQHRPLDRLVSEADRLDELADIADLMGDAPTAARLHGEAARRRERAMSELDRRSRQRRGR